MVGTNCLPVTQSYIADVERSSEKGHRRHLHKTAISVEVLVATAYRWSLRSRLRPLDVLGDTSGL